MSSALCRDHIIAKLKVVSNASPSDEVSIVIANNLKDLLGVDQIECINESALLSVPMLKSLTYDKVSFNITSFTKM